MPHVDSVKTFKSNNNNIYTWFMFINTIKHVTARHFVKTDHSLVSGYSIYFEYALMVNGMRPHEDKVNIAGLSWGQP